jgi:hypothetical protein
MKTAQPAQPDPTDIPLEGDQEPAGPIDVRLFTIPGSHPGVAVQLMLEHKTFPSSGLNCCRSCRGGCSRRCDSRG